MPKKWFIFLILVVVCFRGNSQPLSSVRGTITDASTGNPIPFASVFLAGTFFGTTAQSDGSYTIVNIPPGGYDLTASLVGYKANAVAIVCQEDEIKVDLQLTPKVIQLKEVVISGVDSQKHFKVFQRYFLGRSTNSTRCTIKNPDDIFFTYDKDTDQLTAVADKPIEIENLALGYSLFFSLEEFTFSNKEKLVRFFGYPRFELLTPSGVRQLQRWERERDRAYFGSMEHLMRSLLAGQLQENLFLLRTLDGALVDATSLFVRENANSIFFMEEVKITYRGEFEPPEFSNDGDFQVSQLKFINPVSIYPNGYYDSPKNIIINGYLAWESVSNMVPFGYQPTEK